MEMQGTRGSPRARSRSRVLPAGLLLCGFAGRVLCETADFRLFDDVVFGVASNPSPSPGPLRPGPSLVGGRAADLFSPGAGVFATARLRGERPWSFSRVLAPAPTEPARPRDDKLVRRKTLLLTGAVFVALPIAGYLSWWQKAERRDFHANSEGWFGRDSYAGGADKVSHFVLSYAGSREPGAGSLPWATRGLEPRPRARATSRRP